MILYIMDFVIRSVNENLVDIDFPFPFDLPSLINWLLERDITFEIISDNGWHTDSRNYAKYVKRFTIEFKTDEGLALFLLSWVK